MGYHLVSSESADQGIRRMVREQADKALGEIDDEELDAAQTVHQVRKRCKKIRAALRLVRPGLGDVYTAENAWYRDAARTLSDIRDGRALLECFDVLVDHFTDQLDVDRFRSIREVLSDRQARVERVEDRLDGFRKTIAEGRDRMESWPLEEDGFEILAGGFGKTYRRGRKAMSAAYSDPSTEAFHEWRKRAKYHRYHCGILRDVWAPIVKARRNEVKRLSSHLGGDHDLVVLGRALSEGQDEFGRPRDLEAFFGLIQRRRTELEALSRPLGARVFAEKTKALTGRMQTYWTAWRREASWEPATVERAEVIGAHQ